MATLSGKKGLIVGIANEHSLAYGCASHFCAVGAEPAITYINAKTEPYVRPLAQALQSEIFMPCDVTAPRPTRSRFRAQSLRTGDASISCKTLSLTPARKPPRRLLETLPTSMPAITSWLEGGGNSFTVTAGFSTGFRLD